MLSLNQTIIYDYSIDIFELRENATNFTRELTLASVVSNESGLPALHRKH
ncbi:protein of unknown function [Vibrio tapetis subsp. tapetis]|uniref:Uncharacterized protein n=1 Tax=Vibrio tapetis subsp. tapetis TaxID=1671868 RepID=A0A2N8Z955_9VIBR|nr:protein of unknown function [Vibrio tapetis subsp. tapetis]